MDALGRSLTAKQFMGWEAYASLEPFGQDHWDSLFASIVQMIHNMAVDVKHRKPLDEFRLQYKEVEDKPVQSPIKQTWQEKKAIGMIIAAAWNQKGKDL